MIDFRTLLTINQKRGTLKQGLNFRLIRQLNPLLLWTVCGSNGEDRCLEIACTGRRAAEVQGDVGKRIMKSVWALRFPSHA
jgi:hypothetical protein